VASYNQRFQTVFPYPGHYPADKQQSLEAFSKAITSNLVAGVGYFYGTSIVNRKFSYEWDEDEDTFQTSNTKEHSDDKNSVTGAKLTEPKALLTATPSRSFFPRGFYW
jgi:mannosyl-oligosaccharide glucosidase